jgi:hypothetical protein
MPLTSRQILELAALRSGSGLRGRLEHVRRQLDQAARDRRHVPPSYRALLAALQQVAVDPGPRAPFQHPGRASGAQPAGPRRALTPAELTWLNGLPADPQKVNYDDAVALARLSRQVPNGSADQRLVDAAWQSVRAHNDQVARDNDLAHARNVIDLPEAEFAAALADALADEPDTAALNDRARQTHAREVLADALGARDQVLADALAAIDRQHDALSRRAQRPTGDGQRGIDEAVRRFGGRARVAH